MLWSTLEVPADSKSHATLQRVQDMFGDRTPPAFFEKMAVVPAFLNDFYMNFKKFCFGTGKLDARSRAIVGLAVAHTAGVAELREYFADELKSIGGDDQTVADVIAVQGTCAMYNVFFKFRDLSGSDLFSGMPVGLRAHAFTGTSLTDLEVELINITVSDVNGCKPCTEGHVAKARQLGISDETILESIQCAAVVYAGSQFLKATH